MVDLCSPMAARAQLPCHGLHHGLQGNFSSSTWDTSFSPCAPTLVSWAFLFGCCYSSLAAFASVQFPLVKYIMPVSLAPSLRDLAMARGSSILEPPGVGSVGHVDNFWQLLSETTPVAPPATSQIQYTKIKGQIGSSLIGIMKIGIKSNFL